MRKLIDCGFQYAGEPQTGEESFYTRRSADQHVDFATMSDAEILARIRAFGIASQGVLAETTSRRLRLFAAEPIVNPHVLAKYAGAAPGEIVLHYERARLIRTRDGVLKVTWVEEL
jgi:methionyl-tRNA formyltransferase